METLKGLKTHITTLFICGLAGYAYYMGDTNLLYILLPLLGVQNTFVRSGVKADIAKIIE